MTKSTAKKRSMIEKAKDNTRTMFFANLGFYGMVYDQGQSMVKKSMDKYKTALSKRTELFEDLVTRGEKLQSTVTSTLEERVQPIKEKVVGMTKKPAPAAKKVVKKAETSEAAA